ncbi:2-aminomuconic semialdehyde dehydrogenase-like isoform X2 [Artemia franciscana]|uniref:2-aminomuconic semialdehyde dehydrogenase-like isoform X2 n=1 Tax=Artemia franciscana TaxID=6661 RepID=UPI0032DA12BB
MPPLTNVEIEVKNFISGSFFPSTLGSWLNSFEPSSGKIWARVPDSSPEDVLKAVNSAKEAFSCWSGTPTSQRAAVLMRIADLIDKNLDMLAEAESRDQGKPISMARRVDIPRAALNFRAFAQYAQHALNSSNVQEEAGAFSYTTRSPVGVCGLISPWNLPLYLLTFKIAPALVSGNTVVCKPSEMTSVTAWMLCSIMKDAGLPDGVCNIVFGTGPKAGEALINHPDVQIISFTGSTPVGRHINIVAAPFFKKVSLELGGKNAGIVFPDTDIESCLASVKMSCFLNQGEVCLCTSRLFVHKSIYDNFLERLVALAKSIRVGPWNDEEAFMGALVSKEHLEKVKTYVRYAVEDGGTVHCGETMETVNLGSQWKEGYYMRPTVISGLADDSRCMIDEIFGPVVCVTPFDTEEEVVQRANSVRYGLCAAVWGKDGAQLHRVAQKLEAGTVWLNCWLIRSLDMPFGGTKASGMGRESTRHSIDFYTEEKTICMKFQ